MQHRPAAAKAVTVRCCGTLANKKNVIQALKTARITFFLFLNLKISIRIIWVEK
jgi:hypothetical protein